MNIANSNVNEPDSNFHLLSLVDGPNIHVFNGRKKPEHLEETHTDKGDTPVRQDENQQGVECNAACKSTCAFPVRHNLCNKEDLTSDEVTTSPNLTNTQAFTCGE